MRSELVTSVDSRIQLSFGYFDVRILTESKVPLTDFFESHRSDIRDIEKRIAKAAFAYSSMTSLGDSDQDTKIQKVAEILRTSEK